MADEPEPRGPVDTLLGGRLRLRQPARGHRAGTDAVLLAAAATVFPGDHVLDAGSGVGTVGLALALRDAEVRVTLLEREPVFAALARQNAALNGVGERVVVEEGDLLAGQRIADADLVVSNPPFYAAGTVRHSPNVLKAAAHVAGADGRGAWLRALCQRARPNAGIVVIHRPEALPDLLDAASGRIGAIRIRPIHAREGENAKRILFGGVCGSRAPLALLPALVLHDADGAFTPLTTALHGGKALLPLLDLQTRRRRPRGPASQGG